MSAVTLETLRADFEAARDAMAAHVASYSHGYAHDWDKQTAEDYVYKNKGVEGPRDEYVPAFYDAWRAAHTYLIARDHGLQAAMLFKLSDGAIDPRGAA